MFTSIIIGAIIIVQFLPKSKLSFSDKQEMLKVIEKINAELPRKVGTIGELDYVSYDSSVITYHFTSFGDSSIDTFYESNHNEIGEVMKYGVITLNGQRNSRHRAIKFSTGIIPEKRF